MINLHAGAHLAVGDEEDAPPVKNPSGGAARREKGGRGVKEEGRQELSYFGLNFFSLNF